MAAEKTEEKAKARTVGVGGFPGLRLIGISTEDVVYYGGLGLMTALELVEWPVTVAVGAGYALATHADRSRAEAGSSARRGGARSRDGNA